MRILNSRVKSEIHINLYSHKKSLEPSSVQLKKVRSKNISESSQIGLCWAMALIFVKCCGVAIVLYQMTLQMLSLRVALEFKEITLFTL